MKTCEKYIVSGMRRSEMDKYLEDNNEANYKLCKNYCDGYCWEDPDCYCICDYEGCQPLCEEYEEESY